MAVALQNVFTDCVITRHIVHSSTITSVYNMSVNRVPQELRMFRLTTVDHLENHLFVDQNAINKVVSRLIIEVICEKWRNIDRTNAEMSVL